LSRRFLSNPFHFSSIYRFGLPALFLVAFLFMGAFSLEQKANEEVQAELWADSLMAGMDDDALIGQLFMAAAYSNLDIQHRDEIEMLVRKYKIGGLIFFQGGPVRQAQLTNFYQGAAEIPLFIAMDAENGLGFRLDSTMTFPKQMTLGAIEDNVYVYEMGAEIGRQCKRLGVHINFAPVADINSNAQNPVIGMRSFGESKEKVAEKALAYMKGLQDQQVLAVAKHFPGHGDTDSDSHLTLPVLKHDETRLESVELYPFKKLIEGGVQGIMVAHLFVPAMDNTPNRATTLSPKVVQEKLKTEMGYNGLVFTDALNMKGVSAFYEPGEADVKALLAGNDVLLFSENIPNAIRKIKEGLQKKTISRDQIKASAKKILKAKYWAGLNQQKPIDINHLYEDLNTSSAKALNWELYRYALTVIKREETQLPVRQMAGTRFASISIGAKDPQPLERYLRKYADFRSFRLRKNPDVSEWQAIFDSLARYEVVVLSLHQTDKLPGKDGSYGLGATSLAFFQKLNERFKEKLIVTVFGNPYSLKPFLPAQNLICAYEDHEASMSVLPQLIFGAGTYSATLPVSVHHGLKYGSHHPITEDLLRLKYGYPEAVGLNSNVLDRIDEMVTRSIREGATPGAQVLIARRGTVVFDRCYGNLMYHNSTAVNPETIFDIASITKVAATTQALMFLWERGLINLDASIETYLPELKNTNKGPLILREVMTHQAGLMPFLPHWSQTLEKGGKWKAEYYDTIASASFPIAVAQGLYTSKTTEDSVWKWTIDSPLMKRTKKGKRYLPYGYVYSDIGFYLMQRMVERITAQPIEDFVQQNFYEPLGMYHSLYRPLTQFPIEQIAPTERDTVFRKGLVRGYVHDQGAALMDGVGGHAGVFSTANDLAILFQMNLQNGYYGGGRYLQAGTLPVFTARQFSSNRRGLGWDKPAREGGPTSKFCPISTYGHTGFTGTCAWVDPENELVYIFLSNRVYPDAENKLLIKNGLRTWCQTMIYSAIMPDPR
jgi:beta-N-acetylhexosaminidase